MARDLARELEKLGWTVWFDEDEMFGHMDTRMTKGIDDSRVVVVFISIEYCRKVNDGDRRSNVAKELNYAISQNKLLLPICVDPSMRPTDLSGNMSMTFGSFYIIDGCEGSARDKAIASTIILKCNAYFHSIDCNGENV